MSVYVSRYILTLDLFRKWQKKITRKSKPLLVIRLFCVVGLLASILTVYIDYLDSYEFCGGFISFVKYIWSDIAMLLLQIFLFWYFFTGRAWLTEIYLKKNPIYNKEYVCYVSEANFFSEIKNGDEVIANTKLNWEFFKKATIYPDFITLSLGNRAFYITKDGLEKPESFELIKNIVKSKLAKVKEYQK